ncbi:glycosyltransferase [Hyphobacterium marinum]|uniref:Glycosyltransferase n=1 Tax=Hyphobacterium marinum TaxID=3116574 RepID=A0ABU7LZN0_9PROT|nr:glycosyltransferase [Hyphobacterium sp. Y6023]MEE2566460.1 glycosyltransferase [Hyphobacterium sp. Y6023]
MSKTCPNSRLHVLCAHEPDADPRIGWTAESAVRHGYDVTVTGWLAERSPGETRPAEHRVVRLGHSAPGKRTIWLYFQIFARLAWPLLPVLGLFAALLFPLWVVMTLVLLPWRILDYGAERLGQHERTTRRIERLVLGVRAWLFWRVDGLFRGRVVKLINGLNAYRWYFFTHAGALARRYVYWLETEPDARPDVIHANDPDALMAAVLAKMAFGCRVIYDAHEYGPDAYILHTWPRSLFYVYERLLMRHVDGAVTVSPPIADKFNRAYGGRPHFDVVPNASPLTEDLDHDPQFALDELARGRMRVLYQGGFAARRGLEEIISGWVDVNDSRAALFLRGPNNAYRDVLVRLAAKTGRLDKSIFFLPSVSEDKLAIAALDADIGLVPYLSHVENHEGACPNKVGQYMQAGLAILSARLPFVASLLAEGQCGRIYDDQKSGAFAASLSAMICAPAEVAAMGEAGRAFARERYNFDAYFPVLDALYRG